MLLHSRQVFKACKIHSAGEKSDPLLLNISDTASKPEILSILGNILAISKLTKIELSVMSIYICQFIQCHIQTYFPIIPILSVWALEY